MMAIYFSYVGGEGETINKLKMIAR